MSQSIEQNDEVSSSFQAHFLMPLLADENASLSGGAQASISVEARTDIFNPDSSALSHSVVGGGDGGVVVVRHVGVIRYIFHVLQLLPIRVTE
jgi:hypothetical protein